MTLTAQCRYCLLVIAVTLLSVSCGGRSASEPSGTITRSTPVAPGGLSGGPSPSATKVTCILVDGGHISGRITQFGTPVPDGQPVNLVFTGGPIEEAPTSSGEYSLPLIARRCGDKLEWISLEFWAGHEGPGLVPDRPDFHFDLDLSPQAYVGLFTPRTCDLAIGSVTGRIMRGNTTVPDGTEVEVRVSSGATGGFSPPSQDPLVQTVFTTAGQYAAATLSERCTDGKVLWEPTRITSLGASVHLTPTAAVTVQNITLP